MSTLVRVSELAEQVRGVSYGKEEASSTARAGYLPVLRAGNITDDGLTFDDLVFVPAERIARKQMIRRNDVVIAASSGSIDVVGKAARALTDYQGGFGAFCKVLRPNPDVDPGYFAHFFRTPAYRRRVSALAAGVNINNLRNEHLDRIEIPLPPLPEQRRLTEILDKADALRGKRRVALGQLNRLTQSIFLDMFGHPVTNPKGWPTKPLGQVMLEVYRYPTYYDINYVPDGIPEVRGELLNEDGTITSDRNRLRFISSHTSARFPRTVLKEGDLVMSVRGTVGKIGIVPHILAGANITANLLRLSPDRDVLDPVFVWHYTQTTSFKAKILNACSSTTILTIKAPDLKRIAIPVPPIESQRKFAACIVAMNDYKCCTGPGSLDTSCRYEIRETSSRSTRSVGS